jgi:hypothetical protein
MRADLRLSMSWPHVSIIPKLIVLPGHHGRAMIPVASLALRSDIASHRLTIKCQDRSSGLAGFWPDKSDQYKSTMRTNERHLARSYSVSPGR